MPINFHARENMYSYSGRNVDPAWMALIANLVEIEGKIGADIGCGGGIYTRALLQMGAKRVTGIDVSETMIEAAQEQNKDENDSLMFMQGDACRTGLESNQYHFILERALIHHINDLEACFKEAYRLLKENGVLIVQDRTPEDCLLPGSSRHLRGYLFEFYPRLIDHEISRRHPRETVEKSLADAGFNRIDSHVFWEKRKRYDTFAQLERELMERKGRSILHELTDEEIRAFVHNLMERIQDSVNGEIIEADRWTIWIAHKQKERH